MRPDLKSGRFRFESVLICFLFYGRLAEWMIALVLKTSERDERSTGSNPVPSAKKDVHRHPWYSIEYTSTFFKTM